MDRTEEGGRLVRQHPRWRRNAARTHTSPARILRDFAIIPPAPRSGFEGMYITRQGDVNQEHLTWRRELIDECLTHAPESASLHSGSLTNGAEPLSAFQGLRSLPSHSMPLTLPPLLQKTKIERFANPSHRRLYQDMLSSFFAKAEPYTGPIMLSLQYSQELMGSWKRMSHTVM